MPAISFSLRKGLAVFIGLAAITALAVLFFTVDAGTWSLLSSLKEWDFLLALSAAALSWLFEALRFKILVEAAGERISFKMGLYLTFLNYFGSAVTPMQSGGGPFQVYMLYKNGINVGKGIAITLMRTLMVLFLLGAMVIMALFLQPQILNGQTLVEGLLGYVTVVVLGVWFVTVLSLLRPRIMKRLIGGLTLRLSKVGLIRDTLAFKVIRFINREIDNYCDNFRIFFSSGLKRCMIAFALTSLQLFCLFLVLPLLVWSMGLPADLMTAMMLQAVFTFVLYFVPTPGASGVAEGGATALFKLLVPWNVAGVTALLWRIFTAYIPVFLGAIAAVYLLGKGINGEIDEPYDE